MGKILAICTSPRRGTLKTPVPSAVLTPEWGIVGDAHGGSWHRQVSLLSAEKIEAFRQKLWVDYGAFGENLVVEGFDLATLPVPSFFAIGDAVLEMTQIGKECHSDCAIRRQTGDCIMPREGVFARVVKGGTIHTGDEMKLLPTPADLPLRAAVITLSDKGSRGEREDKSGPLIVEMLTATGYKVEEALLLPDDAAQLKTQLLRLADARQVNLILTTGGTGFAPRDITPEVTLSVAERNVPGIAEAMRYHSLTITPRGMLSRGVSVLRGKTLIVNLPGSPKAVKENLEYILPSLAHGIRLAAGLDGIRAMREMGLDAVTLTTVKHPRSLGQMPPLSELIPPTAEEALIMSPEARLLFSGTAEEAIRRFPANVNVAVSLGLAGLGFSRTRVRLFADPCAAGTLHHISARAGDCTLETMTRPAPLPQNPRSSALAMYSVPALLRGLAANPKLAG